MNIKSRVFLGLVIITVVSTFGMYVFRDEPAPAKPADVTPDTEEVGYDVVWVGSGNGAFGIQFTPKGVYTEKEIMQMSEQFWIDGDSRYKAYLDQKKRDDKARE